LLIELVGILAAIPIWHLNILTPKDFRGLPTATLCFTWLLSEEDIIRCARTSATVLKQVPVGRGRYGFVGGAGALQKGKQRARKAGRTVTKEEEVNFQLHPINNWERNLPNDDSWTTTKYRCQSVSIPPSIAKKGRMLCRKLAKGETTEGVETKKFHKMTPSKGTNCVRFAMQILQKINVRSDWVFKFHAKFSPPEAIKRGTLRYIAK